FKNRKGVRSITNAHSFLLHVSSCQIFNYRCGKKERERDTPSPTLPSELHMHINDPHTISRSSLTLKFTIKTSAHH
ncbi:Uncharacterized protein APZ42_004886, partial [Daphnia magna]